MSFPEHTATELERAAISALMKGADTKRLSPEQFADPCSRQLFAAAQRIAASGEEISPLSLFVEINRSDGRSPHPISIHELQEIDALIPTMASFAAIVAGLQRCRIDREKKRIAAGAQEWTTEKLVSAATALAELQSGETSGRPRILLPGPDREDSDFVADVAALLADRAHWFRRGGLVQVVTEDRTGDIAIVRLDVLDPARAITSLEQHAQPGTMSRPRRNSEEEPVFVARSMTPTTAKTLLASDQLRSRLPGLDRLLNFPCPIATRDGGIVWPVAGYNPHFRAWLAKDAPVLQPMTLAEAKTFLTELLADFPFVAEQDRTNAIAHLLTPFVRGLLPRWNCRTPVFAFMANRQRAGKDYLAGLAGILFEGRAIEEGPVPFDGDELRKVLISALRDGRRRMHFSNCRGHLASTEFEAFLTAETYSGRLLGGNDKLTVPNEIDVSLSGNVGVTMTPDLALRSRTVNLAYYDENANGRAFRRADLHGWLAQNRGLALGALAAIVEHWRSVGCPAGPTAFTSFAAWAQVVGGIMFAADLGDPCRPETEAVISANSEESDMGALFAVAADERPGGWWQISELAKHIKDQGEDGALFSWLDLESRSGRTRFGLIVRRFVGRILGGVRMRLDSSGNRTDRHRFQFVRETGGQSGDVGDVGDVSEPLTLREPQTINQDTTAIEPEKVANVSTVPGSPPPPRRHAAPEGTCPTCWHRWGRSISAPRGGEPCARCGERIADQRDEWGLPDF